MNGTGDAGAAGGMRRGMRLWASVLAGALALAAGAPLLRAQAPAGPAYALVSDQELEQLVAPIALYPDSLVAQILAASTFPAQVVEADRWLEAHPDLSGEAVAQAVNDEPWDESVKALTAFPSVLGNMDRNLSWTSSLGDAYYNQPQDVMAAVQTMRERAQAAGNLASTSQQVVTTDGSDIVIDPSSPDIVYVPAYDPWLAYGAPIVAWPGWYAYPGIWFGGPSLSFAAGIPIGFAAGFAWGWHNWNFNWRGRQVLYNRSPYVSRSPTFYNRRSFYGGSAARGPARGPQRPTGRAPGARGPRAGSRAPQAGGRAPQGGNRAPQAGGRAPQAGARAQPPRSPAVTPRSGVMARPFNGNREAARGYGTARGQAGIQSGALSGYDHGGETMDFEARGRASFGAGSPARAAPARSAPARSPAAPRGAGARPAGRR